MRRGIWRRLTNKRWRYVRLAVFAGLLLLGSWLLHLALILRLNASKPVDVFMVLGGSISREIYVAKLAKQNPDVPILISHGSDDPCILLIFEREGARLERVWLERCADSTFGNFFYGVPILEAWEVKKVKVITSATHLPRARWLAQILLGVRGIWAELDIVPEQGVPGNKEFLVKTGLDVARSLLWAPLGQVIKPPCFNVIELDAVDLQAWQEKGFDCENQRKLRIEDKETGGRGENR